MTATITFFPVGNGDMTLLALESGRKILVDVNIRTAADDENDETRDVAEDLRARLDRDSEGRLYVDAFLISHPDQDHCGGVRNHFHLGAPDAYDKDDDKIFIRELWSSPIVFRRAGTQMKLCEDAKALNAEARRRVRRFKDVGHSVGDGDRIQIMGRDEDGKTDDLEDILVEVDELVTKINGKTDGSMNARLLGPLPVSDDEEEEEALEKNRSSVILRFSIQGGGISDKCRFLTGGDAGVAIWERLWANHNDNDWLEYDLLQTPHHCSWRVLSHDSWSEMGEDAAVSTDARNALSQTRDGANIVASSKPIQEDDADPPCVRAKREYVEIADEAGGAFWCTGEYPDESDPEPLEFEIGPSGPSKKFLRKKAPATIVGTAPLHHG